MSLKDRLNKNKQDNSLKDLDIESNEFYIENPSQKQSFDFRNINKKYFIIGGVVVLLIVLVIIISSMLKKEGSSLFDLGNILNQEAVEKNEEQEGIHSLILRNSAWGSTMDDVALEEKGNLVDYGDDYLTCDYETLFGLTWLPTYLFKDNKLVGIVYEANLSLANLDELSSIHQDVAVNIHYVYEQLYRENNKWATGQDRKYDKNLWTNSLLNGKLTMQSVWNSSNEKVFLVTNNKALFGFLEKQKGEPQKASMAFVIVADDFLLQNNFEVLMNIKPSKGTSSSYNANGESIDMVAPDDSNPSNGVDATTNYTGTVHPENLTDEEFDAIYNEINGLNSDKTAVDANGNPISGGTTMDSVGGNTTNNDGSQISNTNNGSNSNGNNNGSGNNSSNNGSSNGNGNQGSNGGSNSSNNGSNSSNGSNTNGSTNGANNGNSSGTDGNIGDVQNGVDNGIIDDPNFNYDDNTPVTEIPVDNTGANDNIPEY